jgi:hypothetical protein
MTRMWARACDKQLSLPVGTSGRSALVWRPARRAPPSRREPRPAKLTPPPPEAVRGAPGSRPPTLRWFRPPRLRILVEASVAGEVDGLGIDAQRATDGGFWRRPAAPAVVTYPRQWSPRRSCVPRHRRGPRSNPGRRRGRRIIPKRSGERIADI